MTEEKLNNWWDQKEYSLGLVGQWILFRKKRHLGFNTITAVSPITDLGVPFIISDNFSHLQIEVDGVLSNINEK